MKYYLYALIALACIAGSCNKATKTQETVTENFVDVSDSLKITESLKYYFEAKIPVFDSITDKSLLKNIYAPTEINTDDYSRNGLQKALLELKERYFSDVKSGDWDWIENFLEIYDKINMEVFSRKDNFLTTVYTHDGYAGGAHGHFQEIYKMFDLKNNKAVLLENIVKNPEDESWDKILRDRLLAEYKEVEDMLLADRIPLNDNFYFDDKGITFVYNHYEITAYAAGIIHIQIPFNKKIEKLLTPDFAKSVLQNTTDVYEQLMKTIEIDDRNSFDKLIKQTSMIDSLIQTDDDEYNSYTLLGYACKYKRFDLVEKLIQLGADVEIGEADEYLVFDVLNVAVQSQDISLVKLLLNNGANPNRINSEEGFTVLSLSCQLGNYDISKLLIENGAKVDGVGDTGFDYIHYPLLHAVESNKIDVVKLLIENNCTIDVKDKQNETAFTIAERKQNQEIMDLLIENYHTQ